jgi:small subunit ribosomal protein S11
MSRLLTTRLAAQSLFRQSQVIAPSCTVNSGRWLSQTSARSAEENSTTPNAEPSKKINARPRSEGLLQSIYGPSQAAESGSSGGPSTDLSQRLVFQALNKTNIDTSALSGGQQTKAPAKRDEEPYHLHVYSHKHNTHVTCTKPNREPIISMSSGNLGFRKSRRSTFDSGYSVAKYVLERLVHTGWPPKMHKLEVVFRGFGQGREAAMKVLLSPEGKILRDKIVRIADSTRVKFGGTRSQRKRRL